MTAKRRSVGTLAAAALILVGAATPSWAETSFSGQAKDDEATLFGWTRSTISGREPGDSTGEFGGRAVAVRPSCTVVDFSSIGENAYVVDMNGCLLGAAPVGLEFLATNPVEPGEPAEPATPTIVVTAEDLQRLPIDPGGLTIQPDRGWVLPNIETIVWTEGVPQDFSTEVLGATVAVRVTPLDFTWDFGDGTVVTTDDPGAPYPEHTVAHTYDDEHDAVSVTLTTRWEGEFEVGGSGVWQPVIGVATTVESSAPFEVSSVEPALTRG